MLTIGTTGSRLFRNMALLVRRHRLRRGKASHVLPCRPDLRFVIRLLTLIGGSLMIMAADLRSTKRSKGAKRTPLKKHYNFSLSYHEALSVSGAVDVNFIMSTKTLL